MTSTPVTLSPQIVGQAENAHQPILTRVLAPTGVTRLQWVALTMTAGAGDTIEEARLAAQVVGALKIDEAAARDTIAELVGAGLFTRQATTVGLTEDGRARHKHIREAIDAIIVPAYSGIPAEDLATAARVLTIITDRLNAA